MRDLIERQVMSLLPRPWNLIADVIDRVPQLGPNAACAKEPIRHKLIEHKQYIDEFGEDMQEIWNWKWIQPKATA